MKKIYIFIFTFILSTSFVFAQNIILDCPYTFTKNLQFGSQDHDVYILQQILNSDRRTLIAADGVGSPGNESSYFGKGTREALKRFQALFIEFIGTANGVFDTRTRQVAQSICNGLQANTQTPTNTPEVNTPTTSVADQIIPTDGPRVALSANVLVLPVATDVKIFLNADREILKPTEDAFILDGGGIREIRKLNKFQYYVLIGQLEGARQISLQVEAEKITDINGVKNTDASNEVSIAISTSGIDETGNAITNTINSVTNTLSNLLQQALGNTAPTQFCNGVQIAANVTCNSSIQPKNQNTSSGSGSGGSSGGGGGGGSSQQQSPISKLGQMLGGMLGGGLGGNKTGSNGPGGAPTAPSGPSALQKAQTEVTSKCGGITSGIESSECMTATQNLIEARQQAGERGDLEEPNEGSPLANGATIPENIPEMCKKNYGYVVTGGCSTKDLIGKVPQKVANAGMSYCVKTGKPVAVTSLHRTPACNESQGGAPKSRHLTGAGIDVPPGSAFGNYLSTQGFKKLDEGNHWHFSAY